MQLTLDRLIEAGREAFHAAVHVAELEADVALLDARRELLQAASAGLKDRPPGFANAESGIVEALLGSSDAAAKDQGGAIGSLLVQPAVEVRKAVTHCLGDFGAGGGDLLDELVLGGNGEFGGG